VGDALYGAPKELRAITARTTRTRGSAKKILESRIPEDGTNRSGALKRGGALSLTRNFLHAAAIEFTHPRTGDPLSFTASLPEELARFLQEVRG